MEFIMFSNYQQFAKVSQSIFAKSARLQSQKVQDFVVKHQDILKNPNQHNWFEFSNALFSLNADLAHLNFSSYQEFYAEAHKLFEEQKQEVQEVVEKVTKKRR